MKFTIEGFSQAKLLEYDIDLTDVLILRWFLDFRATDKMMKLIFEGKEYYWVHYDKLIEDLPILKLKKRSVADRMLKLHEKKILSHATIKNAMGSYSAYNVSENLMSLIYDNNLGGGVAVKTATGSSQNCHRVAVETTTIDYSIKETHLLKNSVAVGNDTFYTENDQKTAATPLKFPKVKNINLTECPPAKEEIEEYAKSINYFIDSVYFLKKYTANGWTMGNGNEIKDWRAVVDIWAKNEKTVAPTKPTARMKFRNEV